MISSAINLGRRRGEFERAAKTMRAVKAGSRNPLKAGVPEIAELAVMAARVTDYYNGQCKEGRLLRGVPDERWINETADAPLAPLDPELFWVFLPETRATVVRHGHVYARHAGQLLAWCEPELFAALGSGYHVAIRFDPTDPILGAAIFNAESGSRNYESWKDGEFLGIAEYTPEAPQITACTGFADDGKISLGKRFNAAVRTEYHAIGPFGLPASAAAETRNGRGGVLRVERGGIAAEVSTDGARKEDGAIGDRALPIGRGAADGARAVSRRSRILTPMELIESKG
jgi:hypothetical protein